MRLIILIFSILPILVFAQEQNKHTYIASFNEKPLAKIDHVLTDNLTKDSNLELIKNQQNQTLEKLNNQFKRLIQPKFIYTHSINGMSLKLTEQEATFMSTLPGVKAVSKEIYLHTTTDATASMVNADKIWTGTQINPLPASKGEGIVVGIIDSGINFSHDSFTDTPEDGYNFANANPNGADTFVGWCDPNNPNYNASYGCNNKIIGAWDFVDALGNESDGPNDGNFHGSNMAGIISGNYITGPPEGFQEINGGILKAPFISGIAPHSHIIMYDVCDNTVGCSASAILAAIDQAIIDGVDVLNYSISGGFDPWGANSIALALLNASNMGIITSASAGNANNQNPETFGLVNNLAPWIVTSGNSYHGRTLSNDVSIISMLPIPDLLTNIYSVISDGVEFAINIEASIVHSKDINSNNENGCLLWNPMDFDDVVALIQSSEECTDESKIQNAQDAGASAVLIFNAESDIPEQMTDINSPTIPATMIGLADANNIIDFIQENFPNKSQVEIIAETTHKVVDALGMVLFRGSYRGPNTSFNVTKPDMVTPGSNVFSAILNINGLPSQYLFGRGTSQAAAVMTGSLALLKSIRPELTPSELKSLVMLSANDNIIFEDGNATNTDDVGSGMLDLEKAANTKLIMSESLDNFTNANPMNNGLPESLNLASLRNNTCVSGCQWSRTFTNTDTIAHTWEFTTNKDESSSVTILDDNIAINQMTLAPGQSKTLDIIYNTVAGALDEYRYRSIYLTDIDSQMPQSKLSVVIYLNDFIFNSVFQ